MMIAKLFRELSMTGNKNADFPNHFRSKGDNLAGLSHRTSAGNTI